MPNRRLPRNHLPQAVAIDLGGSRLRLSAVDRRGRLLANLEAPAVPPYSLARSLKRLWRRWRWRRVPMLLVGSKGIWTMAERRSMKTALGSLAEQVTVMSDAELSLAASGPRPVGIYLVAGTGSMAIGKNRRGRLVRAGGLGPARGDEGSGFWIAKEYLRRKNRLSAAQLRRLYSSPLEVRRTAALAVKILRRRDRLARVIGREAQVHLALLAQNAARQLGAKPPVAIGWGGSLLSDQSFRRGVKRVLGPQFLWARPPRHLTRRAAIMAERIAQGAPRSVAARRGAKK